MAAFLDGRVTLHSGDCLDVLTRFAECSFDSCVSDPPYHLVSIVRRFGKTNESDDTKTSQRVRERADGYANLSGGFMGKQWDGGNVAADSDTWRAVYRVLKPGAHLVAFGGTRTYHRMACAIEDAGFEIRDQIGWAYGSGFPKSHDVSKGIDRAAGAEREPDDYEPNNRNAVYGNGMGGGITTVRGEPATDAAREWQGWGTALKPAWEPIVLARKPLIGTVAANVLAHGTGALNIDGCRVRTEDVLSFGSRQIGDGIKYNPIATERMTPGVQNTLGRWPANIIHDGSDEVMAAFPESVSGTDNGKRGTGGIWSPSSGIPCGPQYGDSGSAARFFYTAKADADERLGSKHPTVKPLDLIQWLVRLVTPRGGLVLDPFAGTGTTGEAAWREGMRAVLIEREAEYVADIERRMALALSGPDERARQSMKEKLKDKPADHGPLFAEIWDKPFYPVPK
jgi:site-specific DNA-methyltransferase (adenine-specific)